MPKRDPRGRSTPTWKRLARSVLEESDVCWLCGYAGADTVDHVVPVSVNPRLAEVRTNLRPAHGRKRTISRDGFNCPGQYAGGAALTNAKRRMKTSEDW